MIPTFDPDGPLPQGLTVLEASAGTGKTHTVASLVGRYVAEGVCPLDRMLIITFGRAASQELRERVRAHLVELARSLAGADPASEQAVRHRRVIDALASFDAATIATTHQFCHVVLNSLGVAGDSDPDVSLVENLDDLVVEVVDDLMISRYASLTAPLIQRGDALALARAVIGDPHTELTPLQPELGSLSHERLAFARAVRSEVDRRKQRRRIMSFDDLLSQLNDALEDPESPARERMRARWSVVLVDEFQDTDPVQWSVLERAFGPGSPTHAIVLIGDPKQAIYAFRGGDIDSYLAAVAQTADRRTLGTNYRSDGPLVEALQVLTRGAELGGEAIRVVPVTAHRSDSRLLGAPHDGPVRLRVVDLPEEDDKPVGIGKMRDLIAIDLADQLAELLSSGATFADGDDTRPVSAGDVAVLMRSVRHAGAIQRELAARGIPSVVGARDSVLTSRAADEWLTLLEALERPSPERVRSVALTSFFGRTAAELDAGGESLTDELAEQVRDLVDIFRQRGIAAVQEAVAGRGLAARVLSQPDGERLLTDLEHVGELLHDVSHGRRLGVVALLAWLRDERREEAGADAARARQRRLDTDTAAVQIVTIHSSKGLQYPIVMLPHAFDTWIPDESREVAVRHHLMGERMLEIGQPLDRDALARSRAEAAAEELRLAYVALTRAQSQLVLWWGRSQNSVNSGLSRLLLGREPGEAVVPTKLYPLPTLAEAQSRFAAWEALGGLTVEAAVPTGRGAIQVEADQAVLTSRRLERAIDTEWRRTSYTGLLRAAEGLAATVEPEVSGTLDEDEPDIDDVPVRADATGPVSPMSSLPAGAGFGSLVHAVLEHADPHATDLERELRDVVAEHLRWWPVDAGVDELVTGLLPLFDSPLGEIADGVTLRDIGRDDRLCELDFEIPLAGGDQGRGAAPDVRLRQIADVMRRHVPREHLLGGYPDHLTGPLGQQALRGYLGGSIDVVLRVGPSDRRRYVVVDYKTNRLGAPDVELTAMDYTPAAMAASMQHSHYPLQAMLYSVVLHRYLRWRLPDYDPDRHLGGIAYLYVRGMCGPQTPEVDGMPCGVFTWRPPAAMITELSDLLAGSGVTYG